MGGGKPGGTGGPDERFDRGRKLSFRKSSPPAVSVLRAVLEPTVNALGALQRVLRCEQPMRPESPKGALDLGDAGLATTVSRQHLRGQP